MGVKERRYEIDWLRVIAFLLLILYHTGMFFVPWDFHFKNSTMSEMFELWMVPLNQFRLPLLFMISGMGAFFVLKHRTGFGYFRERHRRLLIPLIFGMLVIVPPQIYSEHIFKGVNYSSYWDFYKTVFEFKPYPQGGALSWHHLWYILYIFIYSLICFPLLKFMKEKSLGFQEKILSFFSKPGRLYLLILPFLLIYYGMAWKFPTTHSLIDDWYNLLYMLMFFICGIVLISTDGLWNILERFRKTSLIIAAIPFSFLWLFVWGPTFEIMREDTWTFFFLYGFLKNVFTVTILFAILGYSRIFLNRTNKFLKYSTEAVYPFYILHQSVMLVFGLYILRMPLGIFPKFILVVIATFGGSWLIYELLIKRFNVMRVLFGLNPKRKTIPQIDTVPEKNPA